MRAGRARLYAARWLALAVMVLIGLAPARTALAHASLVSSQPEDRAVLPASPERVILIFNEAVSPLRLQLIDPRGKATPLSNIVQHNAAVIVRVPAMLDPGTHVLSWRVVSSDGHPVGGTLIFSIGQPDAAAPALQKPSDQPLRIAIWAVRVAIFVALFFGLGGAVFANGIAAARPLPGRTEALIAGLCAGGLLLLPLSVGLQGLDALELPLPAVGQLSAWQAGFGTTYGTSALMAFAALAAAWLSMAVGAGARLLSFAALAGAGLALAASGHAAAASPQWLTRPAVWMHVVAVAVWIGSLWPLAVLLRADAAPANAALRRFTRVIPWVVVALIVPGGVLAVIQLARVDALWMTNYGLIFSAKFIAAGALLALAAANRFFLTPRVETGDADARRRLGRSIVAEIALVLLIFGLVAGWRFTPPPRSIAAAEEEKSEFIHFHAGKAMADLTLTPGRVGRSSGEIVIRDGQYQPMMPKGVTLVFSQPAAGIEPLRREAVNLGDYRWRVDDVVLPTPGRWRLRIEVLIDDFEQVPLEDDILVRP
jgi:copper transport protein